MHDIERMRVMPQYRELTAGELGVELFDQFERKQVVTDCRRKIDGRWKVLPDPFVDDWTAGDYEYLVACLKRTLETGGVVWGAFVDGALKGFASVERKVFGSEAQYMELSSLHVSSDMRRCGMGAVLFLLAADFARNLGVKKLYISSHPAVETQEFYKAMGCVEAKEYSDDHVERASRDCQLEYVL